MTGEKLELMQYKFVGVISLTKGLLQLPVLLSLASSFNARNGFFLAPPPLPTPTSYCKIVAKRLCRAFQKKLNIERRGKHR